MTSIQNDQTVMSEVQGLSVSNVGPTVGGSNYSSKKASLIGSRIMHNLKIILLGDVYVGKSSLFTRFTANNVSQTYQSSISIETQTKTIDLDQTTCATLEIWDTCGEERFRALTRQYYRTAQGVVLMFDLTVKESFLNLEKWLCDLNSNGNGNVKVILVGNKKDLQKERAVSQKEAEEFAMKNDCSYLEISAMTGFNVELLFEKLAHKLVKKIEESRAKEEKKLEQESFHKKVALDNQTMKKSGKGKEVGCC